MTTIPWHQILSAAQAAAPHLPQPVGGIVSIALAIARGYLAEGNCSITGCPEGLRPKLERADIPAEDIAMQDARGQAAARVRGLDRAAIRSRLDDGADEALSRPFVYKNDGERRAVYDPEVTSKPDAVTCPECIAEDVYGDGESSR